MADTSRQAAFVGRWRSAVRQLMNVAGEVAALDNEMTGLGGTPFFEAYFLANPEPIAQSEFNSSVTTSQQILSWLDGAKEATLFKVAE